MKGMVKKILAVVILLIVLFGVVWVSRFTNRPTSTSTITPSRQNLVATTQTIKENTTNNGYTITVTVEYPQIQGLANQSQQTTINNTITAFLQNKIAAFKQQVAQDQQDYKGPVKQSSLNGTYTIGEITNSLISVNFAISQYEMGAAHPFSYNLPFNYSLKLGRNISVTDVFKPNSNYLSVISQYAINDLNAQYKKMNLDFASFVAEGASPNAKNFQNFILQKNGMVFLFDQGQVGPSVAGPRQVLIPYTSLQPVFNTDILQ